MNKSLIWLSLAGAFLLGSIVGCGAASPTPSATQTPAVITVVVTATPEPATDTPSSPSLTPLPTVVGTETVQALAETPTKALVTPKPAATKKPATPVATVTQTSPPLTLAAVRLVGPNFNPDTGQKDERHSPGDSLVFEWQSLSPLSPGVCYEIRTDFVPTDGEAPTGDSWLQCNSSETQKPTAQTVRFTLYGINKGTPNYSGLVPNPAPDEYVKWYVVVVANQAPDTSGTGPYDPMSGSRQKVLPLSPKSETFQFILKGGGH